MLNSIKQSVTGTIAKALSLIVLLSVATIGYAFVLLASSLNDAEALNVAGSMRMQSYRLAHDIQSQSHDFSSHIYLFERSIYSPSMKALQNWNVPDDITWDYYQLIMRWHELRNVLESEQRSEYLVLVPTFVAQIDAFVFKLQGFSERKLVELAWIGAVGLGGILITSLFVVLFVRREIVHPLKALVVASQQIQSHSFDVELNVVSDNEMGILTRTFNNTAKELGKHYRGLEKAVNEKTHKLQHANQSLQVLYKSSSELTASRITPDNFAAILNHIVSIEGVSAVKLEIGDSTEKPLVLTKGEVSEQYLSSQPLTLDGEHLGQLYWNWDLPCPDQDLIDNFVRILSRAVYYNQAQRKTEQLLLLEERATIARELHDSLAQSLSYLKIQVSLLKRVMKTLETTPNLDKANHIVTDLDSALSGAYTQLRELLTTFRLSIKEGNFGSTLKEVLRQLQEQTTANIILVNELSSVEFDAHEQVHLLQLIREAAINAIKHADATKIEVLCTEEQSNVVIKIIDDGVGIESQEGKLNHYGLSIMHERASRLNGQLTIKTASQKGCEIELIYPRTKDEDFDTM
ncbi:nitrate/nitrite two-component system sensor histidine kinase NarQ [Vibrio sp. 404]|uniref:Sensor protein n=1 Tax=Vibrio marinisediminis TaxID=2758441 RepID=A0A7W2FPF5_9VIBR|nr:nitrate/nitrite two-component system sensor histidine kinase NarQ [Vibrio marinisediminis]MBA5761712.1 nitrate/nitrite two-component system sensor histidine kinase NarQ [Vibrio marinisediminis]